MKRYAGTILVGILLVGTNLGLAPSVGAAASPSQAYVECMDKADGKLVTCLRNADETEYLCWSRFGYAKMWCSVKYLVGSIFE